MASRCPAGSSEAHQCARQRCAHCSCSSTELRGLRSGITQVAKGNGMGVTARQVRYRPLGSEASGQTGPSSSADSTRAHEDEYAAHAATSAHPSPCAINRQRGLLRTADSSWTNQSPRNGTGSACCSTICAPCVRAQRVCHAAGRTWAGSSPNHSKGRREIIVTRSDSCSLAHRCGLRSTSSRAKST
jgi:hypothetical protein